MTPSASKPLSPKKREVAARRNRVRKLWEQKKSDIEIAAALGISRHTILTDRWALGLPRRPTKKMPAESTFQILADLQNTTDSVQRIADRHGLSGQWVHQIYEKAKRFGIRFPDSRTRRER